MSPSKQAHKYNCSIPFSFSPLVPVFLNDSQASHEHTHTNAKLKSVTHVNTLLLVHCEISHNCQVENVSKRSVATDCGIFETQQYRYTVQLQVVVYTTNPNNIINVYNIIHGGFGGCDI